MRGTAYSLSETMSMMLAERGRTVIGGIDGDRHVNRGTEISRTRWMMTSQGHIRHPSV
jgi:hypothetical protein